MVKNDIYTDIAKRTDGDIYIGIVGPVRTGKSVYKAVHGTACHSQYRKRFSQGAGC